jgi:hypothetical protein
MKTNSLYFIKVVDNFCNSSIEEMVAIKRAIEPYQKQKTRERKQEYGKIYGRGKDNEKIDSGKLPQPIGETRDVVAKFVGVGGKNITESRIYC